MISLKLYSIVHHIAVILIADAVDTAKIITVISLGFSFYSNNSNSKKKHNKLATLTNVIFFNCVYFKKQKLLAVLCSEVFFFDENELRKNMWKLHSLFLANFVSFSNRFQKSGINTKIVSFFESSKVSSNASALSSLSVLCLESSLPVKIVKVFLCLLSCLVGNALVVTVVYKHQELRNTITYFIVNMAISDSLE